MAFVISGCSSVSQGSSDSNVDSDEQKPKIVSDFKTSLSAKKIGSIDIDFNKVNVTGSGIIYQNDNNKYGVMSINGENDTGAKFDYVEETDSSISGYFSVISKNSTNDINCCGLIDANGKEIIPMEYAAISLLSNRYVKVVTAKEETTNEDSALVYISDSLFSLVPDSDNGDIMYAGEWKIYDLQNNKFVDNVSGTLPYSIDVAGSFIDYVTDKKKKITVDCNGNEVTDGRKIFDNGSYVLENNNECQVFSTDDKKLFDFNTADYEVNYSKGDYYLAYSSDGNSDEYYLLDKKGEIVSSKFNSAVYDVTLDLLTSDDKIYNFKGENIVEGTFAYGINIDEINKDIYYAYNDDTYVIFDKNGNIIYQDKKYESGDISQSQFSISKKIDEKDVYYCFNDKDFTIDGSYISDWLVSQDSDTAKNIVETRSGKVIIENYDHYSSVDDKTNGITYVIAYNSVNGSSLAGNFDIYTVV